jgi:mannosylfructose-6-phosphate phosphatase
MVDSTMQQSNNVATEQDSRATHMLVSDLDGTLLGDSAASARFADWYAGVAEDLLLVYSSGRAYDSLVDAFTSASLPQPSAVISDVGTMIRTHPGGAIMEGWRERISKGWSADEVRRMLADNPRLELQPEDSQSDLKVSYYVHEVSNDEIDALTKRICTAGIDAQVVYSSQKDLDVLPAGAKKGTAAAYLALDWHIPFDRVMAAGDSGNDRAMLSMGWPGIIVGNAQAELKSLKSLYIYHATATYADGVIEGVQHWLEFSRDNQPSVGA